MFHFFSKWRREKSQSETPAPAAETEVEHGISTFVKGRLNDGMPVDILDDDGSVLCSGRIVQGSYSVLTLGRLPGGLGFKRLEIGREVMLLAYNVDMIRVRLTAHVMESTATRIMFNDWALCDSTSNREDPRIPLDIAGEIFDRKDYRHQAIRRCRIVDLSLSGARLQSIEQFDAGDEFQLRFEVLKNDGKITCYSQVVWVTSKDGTNFEYGILFAEMERWKRHALEESLKTLQTELIRKTKA